MIMLYVPAAILGAVKVNWVSDAIFKLDTDISVSSSNTPLLLASIYTLVTLLRFLPVRVIVVPAVVEEEPIPVVSSLNQYDLTL